MFPTDAGIQQNKWLTQKPYAKGYYAANTNCVQNQQLKANGTAIIQVMYNNVGT